MAKKSSDIGIDFFEKNKTPEMPDSFEDAAGKELSEVLKKFKETAKKRPKQEIVIRIRIFGFVSILQTSNKGMSFLLCMVFLKNLQTVIRNTLMEMCLQKPLEQK